MKSIFTALVAASEHLFAGTPILLAIIAVVCLLAVALISGGIWLVYKGQTANTEINLFGATLKSESVGVVSIFCGVALAILILIGVLRTIEKLGAI